MLSIVVMNMEIIKSSWGIHIHLKAQPLKPFNVSPHPLLSFADFFSGEIDSVTSSGGFWKESINMFSSFKVSWLSVLSWTSKKDIPAEVGDIMDILFRGAGFWLSVGLVVSISIFTARGGPWELWMNCVLANKSYAGTKPIRYGI